MIAILPTYTPLGCIADGANVRSGLGWRTGSHPLESESALRFSCGLLFLSLVRESISISVPNKARDSFALAKANEKKKNPNHLPWIQNI